MKHLAALAIVPALVLCAPAQASCKQKSEAPARLENIVVTPDRAYTASEWAQHEASKKMLVSSVTLPRMVVTPDYTVIDEERRQYAREKAHAASNVMQASSAPSSGNQSKLIRFLRRLFN